jgi:hypothetical protein
VGLETMKGDTFCFWHSKRPQNPKEGKTLLLRHLWRGEVGTSFSPSRPLPSTADQARPAGHSTSLCEAFIRNKLDSMLLGNAVPFIVCAREGVGVAKQTPLLD